MVVNPVLFTAKVLLDPTCVHSGPSDKKVNQLGDQTLFFFVSSLLSQEERITTKKNLLEINEKDVKHRKCAHFLQFKGDEQCWSVR